jgi:hypothetical protein
MNCCSVCHGISSDSIFLLWHHIGMLILSEIWLSYFICYFPCKYAECYAGLDEKLRWNIVILALVYVLAFILQILCHSGFEQIDKSFPSISYTILCSSYFPLAKKSCKSTKMIWFPHLKTCEPEKTQVMEAYDSRTDQVFGFVFIYIYCQYFATQSWRLWRFKDAD